MQTITAINSESTYFIPGASFMKSLRSFLTVAFLSVGIFSSASALDVEFLHEINTRPIGLEASQLAPFGDDAYLFQAGGGVDGHGKELFISDGTEEGTSLLKDINPGQGPSFPTSFTSVMLDGNLVSIFRATAEDTGAELYLTDGTAEGTVLIKDINPGEGSSTPTYLTYDEGKKILYFTADDGIHGTELWRSDGTSAGTYLIKDINPGDADGRPQNLTLTPDGLLAFSADNGSDGRELFISDGTTSGTVQVKDIRPGVVGSNPVYLMWHEATKLLFFSCNDGSNGTELCSSDLNPDGTGTGIFLNISNLASSSSPSYLTAIDSGEYFYFSAEDGVNGRELWISDGTTTNTQIIDVLPGSDGSSPYRTAAYGEGVVFLATTPDNGTELWRASKTNFVRLTDIEPGPESSSISEILVVNNLIYFRSYTQEIGEELYTSNGKPDGLTLYDLFEGPYASAGASGFATNGQEVAFFVRNPVTALYTFSPADPEPVEVARIIAPGGRTRDSYPHFMGQIGETLIFNASDDDHGEELWALEADESVRLIKDILPGKIGGVSSNEAATLNGYVFFSADDFVHGDELWMTDGTEEGTKLVMDIYPGPEESHIDSLTTMGSFVYFIADTPEYGEELWRSDGTTTELVKDITPLTDDTNFGGFRVLGNKLIFTTDYSASGTSDEELWVSDGTAAGTMMLKDINEEGKSYPRELTPFKGKLLFVAETDELGEELWTTDGTEANTSLLIDLIPGSNHPDIDQIVVVGDFAYFTCNFDDTGYELCITDGTPEGTYLLKDITPGEDDTYIEYMYGAETLLYFSAYTETYGTELWVSDGTPEGTVMLKDIWPGEEDSEPEFQIHIADRILFVADDGVHGEELWVSDGTSESTKRLSDIAPGEEDSYPESFYLRNGIAYFTAEDGISGYELWKVAIDECPADDTKLEAGFCGCGILDVDSDGDGALDCNDTCSADPLKDSDGVCGCGLPDTDSDGDGTPDCVDECSADALKATAGSCGCGVQDEDLDNSGVPDCLIAEEISTRGELLATLLNEFKKKPKKGRKARARTIFQAFKDLNAYSRSQLDAFTTSTPKKTKKLLKRLRKKIKKFKKNPKNGTKRKSLKALAKFLTIAP